MAAAATSASTSTAVTAPTNPDTQITNLKKDIQKLSDELRSKNDLLNSLLDLAHQQSMHIASLKAAVEDTVHWDPDTSPRPSSSSTPKQLWSEVVCRRKRPLDRDGLLLSNRYDVLSAPTSDDVLLEAENHRPVAASRPEKESRPPSASGGSSSAKRRQLLRDAVCLYHESHPSPHPTRAEAESLTLLKNSGHASAKNSSHASAKNSSHVAVKRLHATAVSSGHAAVRSPCSPWSTSRCQAARRSPLLDPLAPSK
ncbi:uncharacterized protein LOC144991972 [Oryzias latipes]